MDENPLSLEELVAVALRRVEVALPVPLSRKTLGRICRSVLRRTEAHQRLLATNSRRVGRVEVVRELIRRSEAVRFTHPAQMLRTARAAVAVGQGLGPAACLAELREDARAEAWACLANAQRIGGDLRAAEDAWHHADRHCAAGSGDPLIKAKMAWLKGVLRQWQERYPEAIVLLSDAAGQYTRLRETHLAGTVLVSLGIAYRRAENLSAAAVSAFRGSELLDCRRAPELVVAAMNNLVFYLHHAGHHDEAAHYLPFVRELIEAQDQPLELLRLRWLEGKIALSDGKKVEARAHFEAVRRGFVEQSMPYDAALVSLELALVYAESGWTADVERLASEMYPVFVSADLPHETTASLLLFVRAVNEGGASPDLIRDLLARLERRSSAGD